MASISAPIIELSLGGSWRTRVMASSPRAWWRLTESGTGASAFKDSSGNGYHGTASGTVSYQQQGGCPEGGYAVTFGDYIGGFGVADLGTTFTIEAVVNVDSLGSGGSILCNTAETFRFGMTAAGYPTFYYSGAAHDATGGIGTDTWGHVAIVVSAGTGTFYVNGSAVGTCTSVPTGFAPDRISASVTHFYGSIDEVVVYPTALTGTVIAQHAAAAVWTDVSAHVASEEELDLQFGIQGNGPTDRIADVGVCTFTLRNDTTVRPGGASGPGYYSPLHANRCPGFGYGILVRVSWTITSIGSVTYQRFIGRIAGIDPLAGQYGKQRTRIIVHDLMGDIHEALLRNITLQVSQNDAQLVQTLIDALPLAARPLALVLDSGLDTIPYAFQDLGPGEPAVRPLANITNSSLAFFTIDGWGAGRYENRNARPARSVSITFNDSMSGLELPTTLDGVFNHVKATYHPKWIDAAATTVLWKLTGPAPAVGQAETIEIWGEYYKASDPVVKIAGTNQQTLVAGTDYIANSQPDGSGISLTAQIAITATFFATSVKLSINNFGLGTAYMTTLQCKGKGLYDESPVTVESSSVQPYGERVAELDFPYLSDRATAQSHATYLRTQYETMVNQVRSVTFHPQTSESFMQAAMTIALGAKVTVTETVTGVNATVYVQQIRLHISAKGLMTCTFGLAAASYVAP